MLYGFICRCSEAHGIREPFPLIINNNHVHYSYLSFSPPSPLGATSLGSSKLSLPTPASYMTGSISCGRSSGRHPVGLDKWAVCRAITDSVIVPHIGLLSIFAMSKTRIVSDRRVRELWEDTRIRDEHATTRFWDYVSQKQFFTGREWAVSSQQQAGDQIPLPPIPLFSGYWNGYY